MAAELVAWPRERSRRTIADGARTNLAPRTFTHIRRLVDDIVTVDEAEIAAAVRLLAERAGSSSSRPGRWPWRRPRSVPPRQG